MSIDLEEPIKYVVQETTLSLADVTPKRLSAYCAVLGLEDFSALKDKAAVTQLNRSALMIFRDVHKTRELMTACLIGDFSEIDWSDFPSKVFNAVMNDFFSQLLAS